MKSETNPGAAVDEADDRLLQAEAERVAALSPDELDRELLARGLDPAALYARGAALAARHAPPQAASASRVVALASARTAPRRTRAAGMVGAALLAAAAVALIVFGRRVFGSREAPIALDPSLPRPRITGDVPPNDPPEIRAAGLRREATAACEGGDWKACSAKLDEAARLDPDGNRAPDVARLRREIEAAWSRKRAPEPH